MTTLEPQLVPSTQYLEYEVTYKVGGVVTDPTVDFIPFISFKNQHGVEPGHDMNAPEWHVAAWLTGSKKPVMVFRTGPKYSGLVLVPGLWYVFLAFDNGVDEAPVLPAGTRRIR